MLALFSRFFPRLRPDGVRALKNRPDSLDEYELWEKRIVAEIGTDGSRHSPPIATDKVLLLSCGHLLKVHVNTIHRCFCEACYLASQSANAENSQPANEPAEERQKQKDETSA